jgi:hypothetical protein
MNIRASRLGKGRAMIYGEVLGTNPEKTPFQIISKLLLFFSYVRYYITAEISLFKTYF